MAESFRCAEWFSCVVTRRLSISQVVASCVVGVPGGEGNDTGQSVGSSVGCVLAAIVVLSLLVLAALWLMSRRRKG